MCDIHSVSDTTELMSSMGIQKAKQSPDKLFIKSMLAGVFISFSGRFLIIVGDGSAPLAQNLGPGIQKMVEAAVFPIGLVLIMNTGAEFFTGNTMYAGLLSTDPYRAYTLKITEIKSSIPWHQMFLRGIAGNWLVCLAVWLAITSRDFHSKVLGIFL
ncbi:unnamed protein product [Rotaria socialis]|uniref:Uncharacterized protein n=1 Tax=Rotaria socialis TaxID=392032 RepID=A0A820VB03_9BILA|nr:unnamed protein product [Rotaria socialis]CAF4497265.1 unnamed protein product [Rotaria socialis]